MQSNILLVEDHKPTRERLVEALQQHPRLNVCAAVPSVSAAHAEIDKEIPQILLTDLELEGGNGIELIQRVAAYSGIQSIVITVFGDEQHVVGAIQAGASGYLLKDSTADDVGQAVVEMIDGGVPISPGIARFLLKRLKSESDTQKDMPVEVDANLPHLTKREKEVLQLIAKGFSYSEIAEMLVLSVHTVTSHIKHIYKKLAVNSRGEAVYEAIQLGLLNPTS